MVASSVICGGYYSCRDSHIRLGGWIDPREEQKWSVYLLGYQSGYSALIGCQSGRFCHVYCLGYMSCYDLQTYGGVIVECDHSSMCPIGWVSNPSDNPTIEPTQIPTVNPTLGYVFTTVSNETKDSSLMPSRDEYGAEVPETTLEYASPASPPIPLLLGIASAFVIISISSIIFCLCIIRMKKRNQSQKNIQNIINNVEQKQNDNKPVGAQKATNLISENSTTIMMTTTSDGVGVVDRVDDRLGIKQWLDGIHLSQYLDHFTQNGYESLEFIREIDNKSQLEEIGILLTGHKTKLMVAIRKLKPKSDDLLNEKEGFGIESTAPPFTQISKQ